MTDLTCMHRLPDVPHKLVLGGNQQQIIQFDVETQKEIRIVSLIFLKWRNIEIFEIFPLKIFK